MAEHYYLKETDIIETDIVRLFTLDILNFYHHPPINSKKEWVKKRTFIRNWRSAQGEAMKSLPIGYEIVSKELLNSNSFEPRKFDLFPMECVWLDHSLAVAKLISHPNQPFIELGTEHVYGTNNPVT